MIFFARSGGGGGLVFVLLFFALVLFSSGGRGAAFPLLFVGLFVLLPFLFLRSAARSVRVVHRGPWPTTYPQPQPQSRRRPPAVDPADVQTVVARLAHDVRTLDAGDDPVARQAMADASERYATASSLLERGGSSDVLRTAWLAAAEGLHATRLVRTRRGLDPGPAPHLPPSTGPQLDRPATVTVGGRQHVGSPTYAPGHRHWFPGGRVDDTYVPGGWYRDPFWPGDVVLTALSFWALGSLMSGGLDGGVDDVAGDTGWGDDGDGGGGWGDEAGTDAGGGWGDGGGGWGDGGTQWGGGGWGDGGGGWGDGGGDFGGGDFGGDW